LHTFIYAVVCWFSFLVINHIFLWCSCCKISRNKIIMQQSVIWTFI
jgi:hypothetical protein